ncbi:MAG: SRPBCC family protein [Thermoleophilaceae bacterium]
MAKDVADAVGTALGKAAREAAQNIGSNGRKRAGPLPGLGRRSSPLSGLKGVAAGAGMAALAPLAKRAISNGADPLKAAGGKVAEGAKETVGNAMPGGGDSKGGAPGAGKGRRMPIQQSVDVAVPLKTAYNQWTQFEEWPDFMHRVDRVSQEDETTVSFKTKIWGISKEFKAEIVDQRPDDRIKWKVTEGLNHTGVVSFHELAPRLTRIELTLDVEPGSMIEKAARGMRHVKRAVRADLKRFKAYIEVKEEESGAWRGTIDDGEKKSRPSRRRKTSSSNGGGQRSSSSRAKSSSSGARSRSSSGRKRGSGSGSGSGSGRKKSSSRS